jgi:hypothetical protein
VIVCATLLGACRWPLCRGGTCGDVTYDTSVAGGNLVVENGFQNGAMGNVSSYSGEAFRQEGESWTGGTHVRLDSAGSGWWVMSSLTVTGATLDDLVPGVTYRSATSGVADDNGVQIDVVGCSGPTVGNWDYDSLAERAEIEVEDLGGGQRRVFWRAWFRYGSSLQLAEGQFDYRTVR